MTFPDDWSVSKFADVADYSIGRTPPRNIPKYWAPSGGSPWVTIGDMSAFGTIMETSEQISEEAAHTIYRSHVAPKGTLLMSFKLSIGRTAVLGIDAYHNEAIIAIRPRTGVDRDFLRYYLPTINFEEYQDRAIKGQTLNKSKINILPVPVPAIAEQRAIVNVLSKIQAAVETQSKIVATLRELKTATMARLFRRGDSNEPLKESDLGTIPQSWKVVELGQLCQIASGGTPSRDNPQYWNGKVPWVKTGEVNYRRIIKTEEHITEMGLANSAAQIFPRGTILMAMYGQGVTRGRVAILDIDAATNQACAALTPHADLDSEFLYSYCEFAYDRIRDFGHGANQKNLSGDILKHILIPLPPKLEEQKKIAGIFKGIDKSIQLQRRRESQIEALFDSALNLLVTGKVRITAE